MGAPNLFARAPSNPVTPLHITIV